MQEHNKIDNLDNLITKLNNDIIYNDKIMFLKNHKLKCFELYVIKCLIIHMKYDSRKKIRFCIHVDQTPESIEKSLSKLLNCGIMKIVFINKKYINEELKKYEIETEKNDIPFSFQLEWNIDDFSIIKFIESLLD